MHPCPASGRHTADRCHGCLSGAHLCCIRPDVSQSGHTPAGGFGNLIALPLQGKARQRGNSVFVDESFTPYPDQWTFLSSVRTLLPTQVDTLLETLCPAGRALGELADEMGVEVSTADVAQTSMESCAPWKPKPVQSLAAQDFLYQPLSIVRADGLYIQKRHLTPVARNQLIRLAAFRNPDFYKKQAMHFSTHNIPRIISTAEEKDDFLVLPRDVRRRFAPYFTVLGPLITVQDESCPGRPLHIAFTGTLRPDQQPAASALLAHHNGVLSATTAFGKTVIAAWLIAQRKVNTLILVHTQTLLNQWQAALTNFCALTNRCHHSPNNTVAGGSSA